LEIDGDSDLRMTQIKIYSCKTERRRGTIDSEQQDVKGWLLGLSKTLNLVIVEKID